VHVVTFDGAFEHSPADSRTLRRVAASVRTPSALARPSVVHRWPCSLDWHLLLKRALRIPLANLELFAPHLLAMLPSPSSLDLCCICPRIGSRESVGIFLSRGFRSSTAMWSSWKPWGRARERERVGLKAYRV